MAQPLETKFMILFEHIVSKLRTPGLTDIEQHTTISKAFEKAQNRNDPGLVGNTNAFKELSDAAVKLAESIVAEGLLNQGDLGWGVLGLWAGTHKLDPGRRVCCDSSFNNISLHTKLYLHGHF